MEQYADLWANRHYFKDTAEIARAVTEMFYAVGDVNRDSVIDIRDLARIGLGFGYFHGEPEYDADADVNWDGIIDTRDIGILLMHWGQRKEHPQHQTVSIFPFCPIAENQQNSDSGKNLDSVTSACYT
ncbi:MAG: hypothetical protein JSW29_03785 [Candidatus Bathyarchaeota archaeon]|nr:MAG: hypothetical protein JSW29_03785 [Candidatus Bathyarchaeota archaeon]